MSKKLHVLLWQGSDMSHLDLRAVIKRRGIYISDTTSLSCKSSAGAKMNEPIKKVTYAEIANQLQKSNQNYSIDDFIENLLKEDHLFIKPKSFTPIEKSFCLFEGAMHTIIAESKEGKSTFSVKELSNTQKKVMFLDGDNNSISMIEQAGDNIQWLQPTEPDGLLDLFIIMVERNVDFSEYVFVIDSLQNFTGGKDLDSNNGMREIVLRLKKLTNTGGTLVVLHHVTATGDSKKPLKPKGNSEVLFSSSDVTYGFTQKDGLTAIKSRIDGVKNGDHIGYGENLPNEKKIKSVQKMIEER